MQFSIIIFSTLAFLWTSVAYSVAILSESTPESASLPSLSPRIIGGKNAKPHSAFFIISFQLLRHHFCGGSIIGEDWILSAAHCFSNRSTTLVNVVAGLHALWDRSHAQVRQVQSYAIHENYKKEIGPFDIALIRVNRVFQFNSFVRKVNLPRDGQRRESGGYATLFGWGIITTLFGKSSPRILQIVNMKIIDYWECDQALGHDSSLDRNSNLCTGPLTGGISGCSGDSGGPLIKNKGNGNFELIGIVSWGIIPCGSANSPTVYTRVSAFTNWINLNFMNMSV